MKIEHKTIFILLLTTISFFPFFSCGNSNNRILLVEGEKKPCDSTLIFKYVDSLEVIAILNDSIFLSSEIINYIKIDKKLIRETNINKREILDDSLKKFKIPLLDIALKNNSNTDLKIPFKNISVVPPICNTYYSQYFLILGSKKIDSTYSYPLHLASTIDSSKDKDYFTILKKNEQLLTQSSISFLSSFDIDTLNPGEYGIQVGFHNFLWEKSEYPVWVGRQRSKIISFKVVTD